MQIMYKSVYKVAKMDCPSEEQLIRMQLEGVEGLKQIDFDIPNRKLNVIHLGDEINIYERLNALNLDSTLIESSAIESYDQIENTVDNLLLWKVLFINLFFFILETIFSIISDSMSLLADGLDMLADSLVYALALYVVNKSILKKKLIAKISGYLQFGLAIVGIIEVLKRFLVQEINPNYINMIIISCLALIGNTYCLYLLQKSKSKEAHIQASMIFTSTDVIVNIGVIVAAILVYYTNSLFPDLIVGSIVFTLVGIGARKILQISK